MPTEEQVRAVLRGITDPELGLNVVDLGLVYGIEVAGKRIRVRMTLTTSTCPFAATLPAQVEEALRAAFAGHEVEVVLVWEPRWTPERMSEGTPPVRHPVTRDLCAICGERVGDRRCPGLDRSLCSTCCGAHRGRSVRCPPDCAYGRVAEERLRERRARELERAWVLWYRELASSGEEGIWPHVELLAEALAALVRDGGGTDAEVEGALRHLDRALSPVVLVPTPPPPLGRALAEEGLLPLVQEGKLDGEGLRKAVQAFVAWLAAYQAPDEPLKFVRGLLGLFPPLPPEPAGLIVRPPGTA